MELAPQRISELLYDEEKIVTNALIANELHITRSDAQNILNNFVKDLGQQKLQNVCVTYLLYGKLKDGKNIGVYLVKEEDLKDKKSLFKDVSTENIFSIQKSKQIDFHMIALANATCEDGVWPLTSKNSVKRTVKSVTLVSTQSSSNSIKQDVIAKASNSVTNGDTKTNISRNGKEQQQSSQRSAKGKQGGIASFFSKAAAKAQSTTQSDNIKNKVADSKETNGSKSQNTVQLKSNKNKTADSNSVTENVTTPNNDKLSDDIVNSPEKMETNLLDQKSEIEQNQSENIKKRKKGNKNKGPNKKRKRIQEICDSDSSDMFDDEQNEDTTEISDEEPVPVPVVASPAPPKNKRRRAVDKTYVDEEGFIVTSTEYIYETASEDDEKEPCKQKLVERKVPEKKNEKIASNNEKPNGVAKPPGNKGKANKKISNAKQPTLMSFFKKS